MKLIQANSAESVNILMYVSFACEYVLSVTVCLCAARVCVCNMCINPCVCKCMCASVILK